MRVLVIGLGVQGQKRVAALGGDAVATADPVAPSARYASIEQAPLDDFDAAFVCTQDREKVGLLRHLLSRRKHVLVEKPLLAREDATILELAELARASGVACYTAYNHRFEPHVRRLRDTLGAGVLGRIYLARLFYGNGTAADVRRSPWRDRGLGVLADLGSHLLDLVLFFFGPPAAKLEAWSVNRFENRAWDHVVFGAGGSPTLALEVSLVCWKNAFRIDVYGDRGSVHVEGLCKWGPSTFTLRRRVFPSGRPTEEIETLECADPTWAAEHEHFERLCATGGTNLENDLWINAVLRELGRAQGGDLDG